MTNKITHTLIIPEELDGSRLDQALAKLLPDYSRVLIQKWIKSGDITLNGEKVKPRTPLDGGETVEVSATLEEKLEWSAQDIPLNIVYEDEALLIINKPVGLIVHPGTGNSDRTLLNALLYYLPSLNTLPRAGIIHRLDKETSGLLIVAKTMPAYTSLTKQLKVRSIKRDYQAIVSGVLISGGTVDAPISRHMFDRKKMAVNESGKPAISHYRIIEKYREHTRLRVSLETGRTHQIRVHMAYIHHPLIGDPVYGERLKLPKGASEELVKMLRLFRRQALHAEELTLEHPTTQETMHWHIDPPEDFLELEKCLKAETIAFRKAQKPR